MKKIWVFILALLLICTAALGNAGDLIASTEEAVQEEMDRDGDPVAAESDEPSGYEEEPVEEGLDEPLPDEGQDSSEQEQYIPDQEEGRT